jgi:hypothetical protein
MISNDALINECGFTQSRVHSQLFMRFAGDKDLILMQKGTDDFKILITTPGGIALKINFMHVLEVKLGWEMTKQDLTSLWVDTAYFSTIDGRHAVTLTQELQIEKWRMLSTGLIERLYLQCTPLPATWC